MARRLALAAGALAGGGIAAGLWWRANPSACPYSQRFWVQAPHPIITRDRLRAVLAPQPGERILEVGPGTGYYTLPVADWLGPTGRLDVFDLQQEMLDHTMRRAAETGLADRISPTQGDARALPYDDATFDAAFLVTVLGEIPDPDAALRELRRVLSPHGRLVVGEIALDPHFVTAGALERRARATGLRVSGRSGGRLGYFAELRSANADAGTDTTGPTTPPRKATR
jgi:ubiquinone/menaquinone biosynthesis C-methylase UbiE